METLGPIFAVVAVLALIAGIVVVVNRLERQRTEALVAACQGMGLVFEPEGDLDALRAQGDLPLYNHGHSKKLKNVMSGQVRDRDVRFFDYQYTTGGGKNSHTWMQTVALFPRAGERLPELLLAPENLFHKIGQVFGYQDIDFDSSPEFSSHYLLRGPDEMAIRSAFSVDALSFFGQHQDWHVEVKDRTVAIYRAGKRCKPEDAPTFLAEAQDVLRVLVHSLT
jgi:hypothetical protein